MSGAKTASRTGRPSTPLTKAARHALIVALLERDEVGSQTELADLLAGEGVVVTQGTVSKDLVDLGAVRVRGGSGRLVYAVPGEGGDRAPRPGAGHAFADRLAKVAGELLLSAEASANLVVLRTPPGGAQYFASAIDKVARPDILGTIAGDDTVMVITRDPAGGEPLAAEFLALAVGEAVTATSDLVEPDRLHDGASTLSIPSRTNSEGRLT